MHTARFILLGLLLGLAAGAEAADPPKDAKAVSAKDAAQPDASGKEDAKADADKPGPQDPTDAPGSAGAAPDAPATDTGLPGREGELVPHLPRLVGEEEVTWLEAEGKRFFVFKRAPKPGGPKRGALVLVPAPQAFIDQRAVTRALREDPLIGGYHTLALQPSLAEPAGPSNLQAAEDPDGQKPAEPAKDEPADAGPGSGAGAESQADAAKALCARLRATIAAAGALVQGSVAVVAEQQHVADALACLAENAPPEVHAFAAVGGWRGEWPKLTVPSLEFVPINDPAAKREADRRARTPPAAGTPPRRQIDIDGTLEPAATEIARRLRGWLNHLPSPEAPEEQKPKTVSG